MATRLRRERGWLSTNKDAGIDTSVENRSLGAEIQHSDDLITNAGDNCNIPVDEDGEVDDHGLYVYLYLQLITQHSICPGQVTCFWNTSILRARAASRRSWRSRSDTLVVKQQLEPVNQDGNGDTSFSG